MSALIKSTILSISIHRADKNPVFGEGVTHVTLQDEGGGVFLEIQQHHDVLHVGQIRLELDELLAVCEAGKKLIGSVAKEFQ